MLETDYNKERASSQEKIDALQSNLIEVSRREAALQVTIERSHEENNSLLHRISDAELRVNDLMAKVNMLESDNKQLQTLRTEQQNAIESLNSKAVEADYLANALRVRSADLESRVTELEDVCNRKIAEIMQLSESQVVLNDKVGHLENDRNQLANELRKTLELLDNEKHEREGLQLRLGALGTRGIELEIPKGLEVSSPAFSEDFGPASPPLSPPSSVRRWRSGKELEISVSAEGVSTLKDRETALIEENDALKVIIKQVIVINLLMSSMG